MIRLTTPPAAVSGPCINGLQVPCPLCRSRLRRRESRPTGICRVISAGMQSSASSGKAAWASSMPRGRPAPGAHDRPQDAVSPRGRRTCRSAALAGGPRRGERQPPEHLSDLRGWRRRGPALHCDGAPRRRSARRPGATRPADDIRGAANRARYPRGTVGAPRARHHSSRPETIERVPDEQRCEGARLRSAPAGVLRSGHRRSSPHADRHRDGHAALYGARAGDRRALRSP